MKTIKLKYVDFWPGFEQGEDLLYRILKESNKYDPVFSDSPDYIIFSTFGRDHLKYDCIRIFYAGEEQSPDFNICDYGIGFDYIEFGDRYFRLPLMYQPQYREDYKRMVERKPRPSDGKRFCSFVYSNPEADSYREYFFDELSKYKQVDSGGKYRNNVGGPVADKYEFESVHKFSIAFENVSHPGYSTEKIMQAFAAGTIPVYWGDPLIGNVFNEKAFINTMEYTDINTVIEYIKYLDTNEDCYQSILNEPALKPEWTLETVEYKFQIFVENIFDQELNTARRTTRQFWNKKYIEMQRKQEKLYQSIAPVRKLRYMLLKGLRK